jgi:hypothetical protein
MLIVLKQDNKEIADLLAIAPRSVLMLRHRFRQKIGLAADNSLETFIEEMLGRQLGTNDSIGSIGSNGTSDITSQPQSSERAE